METELLKRITHIPGLMGGRPTIRGMRFSVKDILELLSTGMTHLEILEEHPALEEDDIKAALLYAALKMDNTIIINAT
ncbi:MAG TPA: DUF433 domain-containing protein [Chitinophagaceae bacterium]